MRIFLLLHLTFPPLVGCYNVCMCLCNNLFFGCFSFCILKSLCDNLFKVMDKSWISSDRLSTAYEEGVKAFLEFAQSNAKLDVIRCPCVDCINLIHHSIDGVRYHLFAHGFDQNYKVWSFHGETFPSVEIRYPNESRPPEFDYTKDMVHDPFAYVENDPDSLKSLLGECDKPLYVGSKYNALSGLLKFQHLKGQFGWSDTSFDALLAVLKDVLPSNNTIPNSIY